MTQLNIDKNREKKRIFVVAPGDLSIPRGTPLRIKRILGHLANDEDFAVTVFTKTDVSDLSVKKIEPTFNFISDITTLVRYYRKHKNAVFLCHTLDTAKYMLLLKLFTRAKIVLEMHGFTADEAYLENNIGRLRYLINSAFHRLIFYISDFITTCSYTATEIISTYNTNTITVIPTSDIEEFSPDVVPTFTFKTKPEQLIIGYAGNARPWQGLDFLIECFTDLRTLYPGKYRLVLLLSGPYEEELDNRNDITVLPKVPHSEVPSFLASCDCLVIPRQQSYVNKVSFPSKLLEYLSMGKPVVASKTSDMHKVIQHGVNGLLFEPGNKEEFIDAIVQLDGHTLRKKISREARESVIQNYTWEAQNKLFLDTLNSFYRKKVL